MIVKLTFLSSFFLLFLVQCFISHDFQKLQEQKIKFFVFLWIFLLEVFQKIKIHPSIHKKKSSIIIIWLNAKKYKIYSSFVNKISSKKKTTHIHIFSNAILEIPIIHQSFNVCKYSFFFVIWWFTIIILNKDYIFIKKKKILTVKIY